MCFFGENGKRLTIPQVLPAWRGCHLGLGFSFLSLLLPLKENAHLGALWTCSWLHVFLGKCIFPHRYGNMSRHGNMPPWSSLAKRNVPFSEIPQLCYTHYLALLKWKELTPMCVQFFRLSELGQTVPFYSIWTMKWVSFLFMGFINPFHLLLFMPQFHTVVLGFLTLPGN